MCTCTGQAAAPGAHEVQIAWKSSEQGQRDLCESFDEVVLAMQANASLKVLHTSTLKQLESLASFRYDPTP